MENIKSYKRIVTHDDLDGVVSASLLSFAYGVNDFFFTSPSAVINKRVNINYTDILCDLPYSINCGCWFDHHVGNRDELVYRNVNLKDIEGAFDDQPSCARVIVNALKDRYTFPENLLNAADIADKVDSFDYATPDEWLAYSDDRIIDFAIKDRGIEYDDRSKLLSLLVKSLKTMSIEELCRDERIATRHKAFRQVIERNLQSIKPLITFHKDDIDKELIIIDLTTQRFQESPIKTLAFVYYPKSLSVLVLTNKFVRGVKTQDLFLSISLGFAAKPLTNLDVSEILRELNLGDGHSGAGSGFYKVYDKRNAEKEKQGLINNIYALWKKQRLSTQ